MRDNMPTEAKCKYKIRNPLFQFIVSRVKYDETHACSNVWRCRLDYDMHMAEYYDSLIFDGDKHHPPGIRFCSVLLMYLYRILFAQTKGIFRAGTIPLLLIFKYSINCVSICGKIIFT